MSLTPILLTDPKIVMIEPNDTYKTSIEIDTKQSFVKSIFIYSFVDGKIADIGLQLDLTVCGLELLESKQKVPLEYKIVQTSSDL